MVGEADTVTEINLGIDFYHSVAGSWVDDVHLDPYLRERCSAGEQWSLLGRAKKKLLRLQVDPLDVLDRQSSSKCPEVT